MIKKFFTYLSSIINTETGVGQILLMLFLVAGVALGGYLVQTRTNILPHAEDEEQQLLDSCVSDCSGASNVCSNESFDCGCDKSVKGEKDCSDQNPEKKPDDDKKNQTNDPGVHDSTNPDDKCRDQGSQSAREECEKKTKSDAGCGDEKTYCDMRGGKNVKVFKHGGYWDGNQCVYDYDEVGECNADKDKSGSLHNEENAENKKLAENSVDCENITYCDKGKSVHKKPSGVDSDGKCKYTFETTEDSKCSGKKDGEVVASEKTQKYTKSGTPITPGTTPTVTTSAETLARQQQVADKNKAELDAARAQLSKEGYEFDAAKTKDQNIADCVAKNGEANREKCTRNMAVLEGLSRAQTAYDQAKTSGLTGPSQVAALDQARLQYRTAACDAVAAGVKGTNCVLDVGDTQNLLTAKVGGKDVRVFVGCSNVDTDANGSCRKVLNYRVCPDSNPKCTDGQIKELPPEAAKAFLKDPNADPSKIYDLSQLSELTTKSIQEICTTSNKACTAAAVVQAGAAKPTSTTGDPAGCETLFRTTYKQGGTEKTCPSGMVVSCTSTPKNDGTGECKVNTCTTECKPRPATPAQPTAAGAGTKTDADCKTTFRTGGTTSGGTKCTAPKGVYCQEKLKADKSDCQITTCSATCVDRK